MLVPGGRKTSGAGQGCAGGEPRGKTSGEAREDLGKGQDKPEPNALGLGSPWWARSWFATTPGAFLGPSPPVPCLGMSSTRRSWVLPSCTPLHTKGRGLQPGRELAPRGAPAHRQHHGLASPSKEAFRGGAQGSRQGRLGAPHAL